MDATNEEAIATLNDLIECSKDGEYGFRASAQHVESDTLRQTLARHAEECQVAADELRNLLVQCDGKPPDRGSALGAVHRGWVAVKGTLAGYTDLAVLKEVERGEDRALATYGKAIKKDLPPFVQAVVQRQYEGVKRNHDEIRALCEQAEAVR
jgi:uncharacterized protein (TIGR02284 family)